MNWRLRYTKTFYRELAKVPEKTRKQIENFAFGEAVRENPFDTSKVEKLTGYSEYYSNRPSESLLNRPSESLLSCQ